MKPFSIIAKRLLVAGSLALLAACSSDGVTGPSEARKKSGYLTVSAAVSAAPAVAAPAPKPVTGVRGPKAPSQVQGSGYNVPAN
ncbi:MAG: hypothetical protein IT355_13910 [Gemmatimonadaceae bacterium]|nr:hypothetical protein [Gemmatimonadaceae bacterium]